jgi:hypothetical protein
VRAVTARTGEHSGDIAPSSGRPRLKPIELAAVFGVCLVAAVVGTWPLARYISTRVPLNLADPLENVWIFSWIAHAMIHSPIHIWSGNIYFPAHHTLAFAESMIGLAAPVAPLYWLTGNGVLTVNVASLLVYAVGGLGVCLLVREMTGQLWPALIAAIAFTVAPYRVQAIGHPHVIAIHLLPFVLLALLRQWRLPLLAVLVALQFYSSFTGAEIMLLAIAGWFAWKLVRSPRTSKELVRGAVGLTLGCLLAVPAIVPYFLVAHEHPENRHAIEETMTYSASPKSYLSPEHFVTGLARGPELWAEGHLPQIAPWEKHLFPGIWLSLAGIASLGAAGIATASRMLVRRKPARPEPPEPDDSSRDAWLGFVGLFALLGLIGFVFSLGPYYGGRAGGLPLPFAIATKLPGNPLRVPARLGELVIFALAALGGIALSRVPKRFRNPAVLASLIVLLVETLPASLQTVASPPVTAAGRAVSRTQGTVLILPTAVVRADGRIFDETMQMEAEAMYASTAHFHPVTNGYASFIPAAAHSLLLHIRDFPSNASMAFLHRRDVRIVVVRLDRVPLSPWGAAASELDRWPGVCLVAADALTRVYDISGARLPESEAASPARACPALPSGPRRP